MEVVTTGISGLDAQLGGGLPKGTTVLLIAEPSNALSLFADQFGAGGLREGERVFHFEFDRQPGRIPENIQRLATAEGQVKGELRLFDGYTTQFRHGQNGHHKGVERIERKAVFDQVMNLLMEQDAGVPYRLALNSLSALSGEGDQAVLDFARNLVHLGHELGGVHLLTLVRGLHSPALETNLKHLAGGVIEMGTERKGFGIYSYLAVTKLLDVRDPTRLLLFRETDKGLWLESTKRVF